MNRHDYTGKTIFMGIDVHKKTYAIAVTCDKLLLKRDTMSAEPENIVKYIKKFFPGAQVKSAYEAGFSGYRLHRHLKENGIENIVVHAASIEISARDRVKTDKRDAVKIATQLEAGRLRGIYEPTKEEEDRREISRYRTTLVREKSRVAARLKQKANYHGLIGASDTQKVCKQWAKKLKEKPMTRDVRYVIDCMIKEWEGVVERIKEVDKRLEEQATKDTNNEIYMSTPGIGKTSARILSNELGDMKQFRNEKQLFSYVGLTPSEYSSGEHTRRGHITRQSRSILRSTLVQCAWIAIRGDENLRQSFERISRRAGAKRAIVAVARRLIGRIRACFIYGEMYQQKGIKAAA